MVDAMNDHELFSLVNLVDHPVRASAGRSQPCQLALERSAHAMGVLQERPDHELDNRCRCALREPTELAMRRTGDLKLKRFILGHRFR